MPSADGLDRLVAQFYASASGEASWALTLAAVVEIFECGAAVLELRDAADVYVSARHHGYTPQFASAFYASEHYAQAPRLPDFLEARPDSIYFDHDLGSMSAILPDPPGAGTCERPSNKYQFGGVLGLPGEMRGYLTILGGNGAGRAPDDSVEALRWMLPHIAQALSLGHLLEQQSLTQAVLLDALSGKVDGLIILGRLGAVSFMNDAARAILSAGDGLGHVGTGFVTRRAGETRSLQNLIGDAMARGPTRETHAQRQMLVTRASGERPYLVRVLQTPATAGFFSAGKAGCVIHLRDLASIRIPEKPLLRMAFGLTEREADLAIELVRCASLSVAAENCGMAINTARNHLQGAFGKTATQHQAELVQLLGRMV